MNVNIHLPVDPNPSSGIYRDLLALSSGTMASLTGYRTYNEVERIQARFAAFYLIYFNRKWESWHDVWFDFMKVGPSVLDLSKPMIKFGNIVQGLTSTEIGI